MDEIRDLIAKRASLIAQHPLYQWLENEAVPLEDRFIFAPLFVTYIMGFSDINKWFMRYRSPANELEQAINQHTYEDQTHSRLFMEDWKKFKFDQQLGWNARQTIQWYFSSHETEIFREYGMEIMKMCANHSDPFIRFAFMEAIETCGYVFFKVTSQVATQRTKLFGQEYRYFGPYHFQRETGGLQGDTDSLKNIILDLDTEQKATAICLVNRIFDMFEVENDHLLYFAQQSLARKKNSLKLEIKIPIQTISHTEELQQHEIGTYRPYQFSQASTTQIALEQLLEHRKKITTNHSLFKWLKNDETISAEAKLQHLALIWVPDIMGYKDLNKYALTYREPTCKEELAINRWTARLQSHYQLFLQDWTALEMDDLLGWNPSETIYFYCLSKYNETQRKNMATFVKFAFMYPCPFLRFWLIEALEVTGSPFFQSTRQLAQQYECETNRRLDYLAGRHGISSPVLEDDKESDPVFFKQYELTNEKVKIATHIINTVFDCIDEQYTLSFELKDLDFKHFLKLPKHLRNL